MSNPDRNVADTVTEGSIILFLYRLCVFHHLGLFECCSRMTPRLGVDRVNDNDIYSIGNFHVTSKADHKC
jgi:hypothetical protein